MQRLDRQWRLGPHGDGGAVRAGGIAAAGSNMRGEEKGAMMMRLVGTRVAILLVSAVLALGAPATVAQGGHPMETYNVELLGQIGGPTYAVAVQGTIAYMGVGRRLVVLDVSTPAEPLWLGQTAILPGGVGDIVVVGSTAYIAAGCLVIIDVSDPTAPRELGSCDTQGGVYNVAVVGNTAYVGTGSGLLIIDVSDPTAPREVGAYDTPGYAGRVVVVGNTAYFLTRTSVDGDSLVIIDVSNPTAPREVGAYDTPEGAHDLAVVGSTAYFLTSTSVDVGAHLSGGLVIIDVSDPTAPRELGNLPGDWPYESFVDVAVVGGTAYIAMNNGYTCEDGLIIVDVSDPTAPSNLGTYGIWHAYAVSGVEVVGSTAYVTAGSGGLFIIDVSDPTAHREMGFYNTPGDAVDVAVVGSIAYVAGPDLAIVDVSDPARPSEVGAVPPAGEYHGVESYHGVTVVGSMAYATVQGLWIFDVSDPTSPRRVGICYGWYVGGVTVAGSMAYVTHGEGELVIVDVSDPTAPSQVGVYDTPGHAWDVAVVGSIAYVAAGTTDVAHEYGGLRIVDVSDATAPREVGAYYTLESAAAVTVVENTAYIADRSGGLFILDISDPTSPSELGVYDTPGDAYDVEVVGNTAYVATGSGLRVVDVSDPTAPREVGAHDTRGGAYEVVGSTVYVAAGSGGLVILRYVASEPTITPTPSITPTPTATPTSTPFQLVSWQQEAEHGTIATPLAVKAGMGASACAYVYSQATAYDAPGVGNLSFDIQVSVPGEYYVWTRAMGLGWNNQSFFVSVDGGAPSVDRIPQIDGQWDWIWQQFDENPISLDTGMHTLGFAGREANARLDYVVLTNDPAYVPPDLPICSAGPWLPLVIKSH